MPSRLKRPLLFSFICGSLCLLHSDVPALRLFPDLCKTPVQALLPHQLLMCALLSDPPIFYHQDLIGVPNGSQPVGYGNDRFAPGQLVDSLLDQMLIFRIDAGCSLIQNDNGSIFQNGPCNGDTLFFPSGKGCRLLPPQRYHTPEAMP